MHTSPNNQAEWNARYLESSQIWSGNPNAALVRESAGLTPGRALDLGCGEGADAIWLARQGWTVTGVDVSDVAVERAHTHAAAAGVDISFELRDLATSATTDTFDLVSSFFLHVPERAQRNETLRVAADAVAPGGTLLVVGHSAAAMAPGHDHAHLETAEEVVELLQLVAPEWIVDVAADVERSATRAHTIDTVVRARRV
ncbi:SAM-dependent methyltransferase [Conyzicola sp.]|uniref:SAM-dependent methyltransferase n=1 Tax=Conyzicola sp. TaxID=1969404 RepID=UPI00398969F4